MKEPITGRDLFVISTLCTGFGALLAWGLFYRWGSAPAAETVKYSDWFQAIGSIIAVAVAIAVPWSIHRNEVKASKRDEELQARTISGALQPFIALYRRRAEWLEAKIESGVEDDKLRKQITDNAFDLSRTIQQFHPKFHLLGDTGAVASDFVASLFWLSNYLEVLKHSQGSPKVRDQALVDCRNTIQLANELDLLLRDFCRSRNRKVT